MAPLACHPTIWVHCRRGAARKEGAAGKGYGGVNLTDRSPCFPCYPRRIANQRRWKVSIASEFEGGGEDTGQVGEGHDVVHPTDIMARLVRYLPCIANLCR